METDKNSLDLHRAKKEEYPTLSRLARKYLCVPGTSTQVERVLDGVAPQQEEAEHVRGDFVHATILERYHGFLNTEHLHLSVFV